MDKNNYLKPLQSIDKQRSLEPKTEAQGLRRRLGVIGVAGIVSLGVAAGAIEGFRNITEDKPDPVKVTYVAKPGDNLWNIAQRVTDGDPRDVVEDLEEQRVALGDTQPDVVSVNETFQVPEDSPLGQQVIDDRKDGNG